MRLIDADTLIGYVESTGLGAGLDTSQEDIIEAIERCPLAYDVDKVVERLETKKTRATALKKKYISEYFKGKADAFEFAIKIVKGGGAEC